MERKGWYMVAYDIADPRRLSRIHRLLKKKGIAAQKSVFFVKGTETLMNRLMDQIADLMKLKEDDLRAYPILDPSEVWAMGPNPLADFPVVDFESKDRDQKQSGWKRWFKLFHKGG